MGKLADNVHVGAQHPLPAIPTRRLRRDARRRRTVVAVEASPEVLVGAEHHPRAMDEPQTAAAAAATVSTLLQVHHVSDVNVRQLVSHHRVDDVSIQVDEVRVFYTLRASERGWNKQNK